MWLLIAVILATSFFHLTKAVRDNDFFWHLKSGQWIWEHSAFPERDPFAYTTSVLESGRVRFILTSAWLSQVLFYLFFLAGGMPGIVMSRFLIAGLLCFIMWKLQKGDKLFYMALFAMSFSLILKSYPLERPHLFSFIFFGAILFLLEKIKSGESNRSAFIFLPAIMFIWANMHGGYALGIMTILLYIAMESLKFAHPSLMPLSGDMYRKLLFIGIAAIAVSFINPGTYHVFSKGVLFQPAIVVSDNVEFQPTFRIFSRYADYSILIYWFILVSAVSAFLIENRRADITKVCLVACIGYFSFMSVRYVAFLLIAALPVIGETFSRLRFFKIIRAAAYSSALLIAVYFAMPYTGLESLKSGQWVDDHKFPVKAADYIEQNNLEGNMYNFFDYGGYLIWRLAPERKVFIDGRTLDSVLYEQSMIIDKALVERQTGMPVWKYLLNERHIEYVVISCLKRNRSFPLCQTLFMDRDWLPVYSDETSAIFVRNEGLNS